MPGVTKNEEQFMANKRNSFSKNNEKPKQQEKYDSHFQG